MQLKTVYTAILLFCLSVPTLFGRQTLAPRYDLPHRIVIAETEGQELAARSLDLRWRSFSDNPKIPTFISPQEFISNPNYADIDQVNLRAEVVNTTNQQLALWIPEISNYQFFLNGRALYQQGDLYGNAPQRGDRVLNLGMTGRYDIHMIINKKHMTWNKLHHPIQIGPAKVIEEENRRKDLSISAVIGGAFFSAVYHLIFYLLNRESKATLYFSLFSAMMVVRSGLDSDVGFLMYFFPISWEWSWKLGFIGYFLAVPSMVAFIQHTFPKTIPDWFTRFCWFAALAFTLMTLATSNEFYGEQTSYFHLVSLSAILIVTIGYIKAVFHKMVGASLLILGVFVLTLSAVNDILLIEGHIQSVEITHWGLYAFVLSQMLILAMKFSSSFNMLRHASREFSKIVYPHVANNIFLGGRVEDTMPRDIAQAAVLCFDIVRSTTIIHPKFHEQVERLMTRVYGLLQEGYDDYQLIATGYRIKEVGDGLICSVGFPFDLPDDKTPEETAVRLAIRMCDIFREEMQKLDYHEDLFCGIGICSGEIEGFFPKSGVKQYDVRGTTVNRANRYESMRNRVFKLYGHNGSVIFIQDYVYENLPDSLKKCFIRWNCNAPDKMIRDDPTAKVAWFMFVPHARSKSRRLTATAS